MSKKLYLVTCKGMTYRTGGGQSHGVAYVIADNSDDAYQRVRDSLDNRNIGFRHDREMASVELLAEQDDYPDCGVTLYA